MLVLAGFRSQNLSIFEFSSVLSPDFKGNRPGMNNKKKKKKKKTKKKKKKKTWIVVDL